MRERTSHKRSSSQIRMTFEEKIAHKKIHTVLHLGGARTHAVELFCSSSRAVMMQAGKGSRLGAISIVLLTGSNLGFCIVRDLTKKWQHVVQLGSPLILILIWNAHNTNGFAVQYNSKKVRALTRLMAGLFLSTMQSG